MFRADSGPVRGPCWQVCLALLLRASWPHRHLSLGCHRARRCGAWTVVVGASTGLSDGSLWGCQTGDVGGCVWVANIPASRRRSRPALRDRDGRAGVDRGGRRRAPLLPRLDHAAERRHRALPRIHGRTRTVRMSTPEVIYQSKSSAGCRLTHHAIMTTTAPLYRRVDPIEHLRNRMPADLAAIDAAAALLRSPHGARLRAAVMSTLPTPDLHDVVLCTTRRPPGSTAVAQGTLGGRLRRVPD